MLRSVSAAAVFAFPPRKKSPFIDGHYLSGWFIKNIFGLFGWSLRDRSNCSIRQYWKLGEKFYVTGQASATLEEQVLDVGLSLVESEAFWSSGLAAETSAGEEGEVLRIAHWFERSEVVADPLNRFILAWIGFNGLYGIYADGSENQVDMFKSTIKDLIKQAEADNLIHQLQGLHGLAGIKCPSESGKKLYNEELKNALNVTPRDSREILWLAVRCVYWDTETGVS